LHLIFQCLRLVQDFSAVRSLKLPLPPGAFDFFPVPFRSNLSSVRGWLRVLRRCGSSPPPADSSVPPPWAAPGFKHSQPQPPTHSVSLRCNPASTVLHLAPHQPASQDHGLPLSPFFVVMPSSAHLRRFPGTRRAQLGEEHGVNHLLC
jgi:hypothetical protein